MTAREWENAARSQMIRAHKAEIQCKDAHHAINLFINESIDWFLSIKDRDGAEHKFGIGVVLDQPASAPLIGEIQGLGTHDRCIVFWHTTNQTPDGRTAKYMTTCSLEEFRDVPRDLEESHEPGWEQVAELAREALKLVDDACRARLERARKSKQTRLAVVT